MKNIFPYFHNVDLNLMREKSHKKIERMMDLTKMAVCYKTLEGMRLRENFEVSPSKRKCCLNHLISNIKNDEGEVLFPANSRSTGDLWRNTDLRVDQLKKRFEKLKFENIEDSSSDEE